ncbi:hypothetical protein ANN_17455 [Periplaneta americana]|uniref:Uncharacterized protein n=1 Tax=Periplaneta americana TaxID=6978 RepID=A0ABQ8SUE6_PERAM|nr:hypothetical protein ANN_17455 [Periplaneta americana]
MLKDMLIELKSARVVWGEDKCKQDEDHGYRKVPVRIRNEAVEQINNFTYLGVGLLFLDSRLDDKSFSTE